MRLKGLLLAAAALLLLAGCATQSQPGGSEALPARVIRVKGAARWASDYGMPWQVVKVGTRLPPGAVIEAGVNSRVDIRLGERSRRTEEHNRTPSRVEVEMPNSVSRMHQDDPVALERWHRPSEILTYRVPRDNMIRLWENSLVRFDRLARRRSGAGTRVGEEVRLNLRAGHMFGAVPKLAEASSYEIEFGPCVGRVLGTVYDVAVEGVVKVLVGSVSVTWPGSPTPQVVLSLQEFDARTGVLRVTSFLYGSSPAR
jgi:hypothetical protein